MPKPTFMQTVLRKPTQKYASSSYASPWADPEPQYDNEDDDSSIYSRPQSRYEYRREPQDVYPGMREVRNSNGYNEAGPSTRPRKARSEISVASEDIGPSSASRFPKPARRVASVVAVRDGSIMRLGDERESVPSRSATIRKAKTVRQKKSSMDTSSMVSSTRDTSSPKVSRRSAVEDSGYQRSEAGPSRQSTQESMAYSSRTPSLQQPSLRTQSDTSSLTSSLLRPVSDETPVIVKGGTQRTRPQATAVQKLVKNGSAPLTPPDSVRSSAASSWASHERNNTDSTITQPVQAAVEPQQTRRTERSRQPNGSLSNTQRKRVSLVQEETDGEDDVFYTPESSPRTDTTASVPSNAAPDIITPPMESSHNAPPIFSLQPPTPAPIESNDSPFHREGPPTLGLPLSHNLSPTPNISSPYTEVAQEISESPIDDEEMHSVHGEVGSDDEDKEPERKGSPSSARGLHSRQQSFSGSHKSHSRPQSVAGSRYQGSVDGRISLSRQSTNKILPRPPSDDFKNNRRNSMPLSEASFGARSIRSGREGSIRTSVSGYGKGGWAAAAAAGSTSVSGTNSPVMMYMPTSGNDGWADFQPPPRQSRFTPLPAASRPMTFDRLLAGPSQVSGSSAPPSQSGLQVPSVPSGRSSPSDYSQSSDEEEEEEDYDLPKPSRSYAKTEDTPGSSDGASQYQIRQGSISNQYEKTSPVDMRRLSIASGGPPPVPPPKNPRRSSVATSYSTSPVPPPAENFPSISRSNSVYQPTLNRPVSRGYNEFGVPESYAQNNSPMIDPSPFHSSDESPDYTRPTSPVNRPTTPGRFDAPSFLNPDTLTLLPEMTVEDSAKTYLPAPNDNGRNKRASWQDNRSIRRSNSVWGVGRSGRSETGHNKNEEDGDTVADLPKRSQSAMGYRPVSYAGGSSYGEGVLMQSDGRGERSNGYSNLILPAGAFVPSHPSRTIPKTIDPRVLGLPHTAMASITLSTSAHRLPMTPMHLRANLPPPVDFTNHLKPPTKTGGYQLLIQVYAVAVDEMDVNAIEEKGKGDVGKWVPGRSFVGRCLMVGATEKDIVRGDIVIGLVDVRKSGALSEYILIDRRRLARAPHPTNLTLEQMSLLPLYGVPAARAVRTHLIRHSRALIMDAHIGIAALICQEMARAGVHVVAVIAGGEHHHDSQTRCMMNGARGVLTGSPVAVMNGLDEWGWDYVLDTVGGPRIYEAAKRILKDGGKIVSLVSPEPSLPPAAQASKPSGFKTLRAAFKSHKKKDSKFIGYEYLPVAGSGEPEVDSSGVDVRDILEEPCMSTFRPDVRIVYPLERGMEAFRSPAETSVVRLIN